MRSSKNPSSSSSASSVVEPLMHRRRKHKFRNEEEEMGLRGSSCQPLEVSKGAHKLNDMIGSSKDITRDLSRGALDLQESLVMLERLQEASKFMACAKQRQSSSELVFNEEGFRCRKFGSSQFECENSYHEFETPKILSDRSSSNRIGELKRTIRESLSEKNLLSASADEGVALSDRWRSDSFTDTVIDQPKKANEPNLIAKLMGLEGAMPTGTISTNKIQPEPKNQKSNPPRSVFDISFSKPRKPEFVEQRIADPKRKTLNEILESMHLKGLLKADQVEDDHSSFTSYGQSFRSEYWTMNDEMPPIVIIKPLFLVLQETQTLELVQKEKVSENESVLQNSEAPKAIQAVLIKEEPLPKTKLSSIHKPNKKEEAKANKKLEERRKPQPERQKVSVKRQISSQAKTAPLVKPRKQDTRPVSAKTAPSKSTSHQCKPTRPILRNPVGPSKKNQIKQVNRESAVAKSDTEKSRCKGGGNNVNQSRKINCISSKESSLVDERITKQTERRSDENDSKGHGISIPSPVRGVTLITDQELETETKHHIDIRTTMKKPHKPSDSLKLMLLSSPAFISHAKELFDIERHQSIDIPMMDMEEFITSNVRLYLDCANELITRKRHSHICARKLRVPLGQVVEEVSAGIERLKSYGETGGGDVISRNSLYMMLERDLMCRDVLINGVWGLGWVKGVSFEEGEQAVIEVVELLLMGFIGEVVMDLLS
ncbi:hypothetical protein QJS10_CPB20g00683 [Acorus calamus]|uniref:DUF4378 domain-containing protein n=1 Tax=Acorus calamus TaxID=4465 RepID=A0AAV9C7L2_ACOCL|nr:hypothetical protein QJS10_CPB20g00683 [Acorus calamus]